MIHISNSYRLLLACCLPSLVFGRLGGGPTSEVAKSQASSSSSAFFSVAAAVAAEPTNATSGNVEGKNLTEPESLGLAGRGWHRQTCTASYTHDCRATRSCCDPGKTCFEKNKWWAGCLDACVPGVHWSDPVGHRDPWSCKALSQHAAAATTTLEPTITTEAPTTSTTLLQTTTTIIAATTTTVVTATSAKEEDAAHNDKNKHGADDSDSTDAPKDQTKPNSTGNSTTGNLSYFLSPSLNQPSDGDVLTFYMYRAMTNQDYELENINAANLEGAMWYLQHEVVSGAYGPGMKYGISRILRLKVKVKATQPLIDLGMNFGVRVAFDFAQCTGPSCDFNWRNFGYNVGCNKLGGYPYPQFDTHYHGAIWYSLPGKCPSKTFWSRDESCEVAEPGGRCAGTPTGTWNCTWNYERAGEIPVSALYEGTNMTAFWADPKDEDANAKKVAVARKLFEEKYGKDPDVPPCDFNLLSFNSVSKPRR